MLRYQYFPMISPNPYTIRRRPPTAQMSESVEVVTRVQKVEAQRTVISGTGSTSDMGLSEHTSEAVLCVENRIGLLEK